MSLYPVLIDRRPAFLRDADPTSVLLMPAGMGTLLDELRTSLEPLGGAPFVVAAPDSDDAYFERLELAVGADHVLRTADALRHCVALLEPSDELLLIDLQRYPQMGYDFGALFGMRENRSARHLVSMPSPSSGVRERAWVTPDGRLRRIQRYFNTNAWPFAAGVLCSTVPVPVFTAVDDLRLDSLTRLRRDLADIGVPSQDIPFAGSTLDLGGEDGMLRLLERVATCGPRHTGSSRSADAQAGRARALGPDVHVAATARIIGQVVLEKGVEVGEEAIIVGPAVIGVGARIGAGAVIAQCMVLPDTLVPARAVFRQRVVHKGMTPDAEGSAWRPYVGRQHESSEPERSYADLGGRYVRVKRWVDGVVALAALLLLLPILLLVALAIKLTSQGPIFFGHTREGLDGRPFRCWKFRTMCVGADAAWHRMRAAAQSDGPQFKMAADPRVTSIGRLLRAANVDELPQLLNVVRGEMSLVGPRPSPLRENQICVPWRRGRLSVRPGITGLWQICRHDREHGDFHQWIEFDLLYVRSMCASLDLKILLATVLTLGGKWPMKTRWLIPATERARDLPAAAA